MKNILKNIAAGLVVIISLPLSFIGASAYITWLTNRGTHHLVYYAVYPLSAILVLVVAYILGAMLRRK
jgi:hypothetical protein